MWSQDQHYKVYKALLSGERAIPSLNTYWLSMASQVMALSSKGATFHIPFVLDAIRSDPDLSQLMINVANFHRYYGADEIDTVESALYVLKASEVVEIIHLFAIRNAVLDDALPANHIIRALWEDAIQVASISTAIRMRLSKHQPVSGPSLLVGLMHQIGAIVLINHYRDKGLSVPELANVSDIPSAFTSNIASLVALKWGLDEAIYDVAIKKGQCKKVTNNSFQITDILNMAVIYHLSRERVGGSGLQMKDSLPFIKAVKCKLIQEEASYFTQMISGHSLIIFKGLSPLINKFPIAQVSRHRSRVSRLG